MRAAIVWLLLAFLSAPALAESGLEVALVYDARSEVPLLRAEIVPAGSAWPPVVEWPLPAGTLLGVHDERGEPLDAEITEDGTLRVRPGGASAVHVAMETEPVVARSEDIREGAFVSAGGDYAVLAPPGWIVLDQTPLPHARVVFGLASRTPLEPPADPEDGLVRRLAIGDDGAILEVWWRADRRELGYAPAAPAGWTEQGREDLWGPLPPGTGPWEATAGPSLVRLRLAPAGPYPVAGIGVEAHADVRAFVEGRGEVTAFHATLPTGVGGWPVREGGPFVVHARSTEDAEFVARAGELAAPVLARVLQDAGLPARERIVVVLSPGGESGWERWGFVQPEAFVRERRMGGELWDEAAILVHEGFHGGQFDAAPWIDLPWWTEGSAYETDRYLPEEAHGRYHPVALDAEGVRRLERDGFDFRWRQPDPTLTPAQTQHRYATSRHIVAAYRDAAGEDAWRAVWGRIAADRGCCDHPRLLTILVDEAPGLTVEEIVRARYGAPDGPATRVPTPGSAPTPAASVLLAALVALGLSRAARG